jgi:ATP-dependent RNA helicase RhlE
MKYTIPVLPWPKEVKVSSQLAPEEQEKPIEQVEIPQKKSAIEKGAAFHEKSAKNNKPKVAKKRYSDKMKEKFGKPIRRGDKIQNMKAKKRKK